jgi:hypothetical protein
MFTLSQLNALDAAIASGQLSVNYDGKSITYRSIGELMKARDLVRSELISTGQLSTSPLSNRGPASLASFSRD